MTMSWNKEYDLRRAIRNGREKVIYLITDALASDTPHPVLIYAARYLITEYEPGELPDWVEALANANSDVWKSVIDEVRRLKNAEEMK